MASLKTVDLTTCYRSRRHAEVRAVDGVSLDVEDGEFVVLLGASGSGKTTLIRTIAGLETPTSGEIHIGGRLANDLPPRARNIAMVFQSYALYPHKTVFGNVAFPLEAAGMARSEIAGKVRWATGLLHIDHLLERKPRMLSGGEGQRVALARALVREPTMFLMDEPLSNLDAKLRLSARRELKRVHERTRVTTVYVTHDQVEAMSLGERVAVMNRGRIEQIGPPRELYREPANTFVARFMGSPPMNLVRQGDVLVGFHAEDFVRAEAATDADTAQFTFHVQMIEDLGPEYLIYGHVREDQSEDEPAEVISRLPAAKVDGLTEGEDHRFAVAQRLMCRYDPTSGLRVG